MAFWEYGGWPPYVSAAERRAKAARVIARLRKQGRTLSPVTLEGRTIAATFWGKAWCKNLEGYGDYESRLPRGRTYARNGSVIDLQINQGAITALVQGSELYEVAVRVKPVSRASWKKVTEACSGHIDSIVELLAGRLSKGVMEVICKRGGGLFPEPREIEFECSCPDAAWMCKHVAAVLYGVGARLDRAPELLFKLRAANHLDLVAAATAIPTVAAKKSKIADDLGSIFGIELAGSARTAPPTRTVRKARARVATSRRSRA